MRMMARHTAVVLLVLAAQVQAVVHRDDEPRAPPPTAAERKVKEQIKAYVKNQARKENPPLLKPVVFKKHDAVEIKLEGQMYPCQIVEIDRKTGLITVAFAFGPAKIPVQVAGIPRKTLRKISTIQWMDNTHRLKHQDPEAINRVVSLATKLAKWSAMPAGEQDVVRKLAEIQKAAALGSKQAADAKPAVATHKLKAQAAHTKTQNEKAAQASAAQAQRERERAERLKTANRERAARVRAAKAKQAQAHADMLAGRKPAPASDDAPLEA